MSTPITLAEVRPYLSLDEERILAAIEEDLKDDIEGAQGTLDTYIGWLVTLYGNEVLEERRIGAMVIL